MTVENDRQTVSRDLESRMRLAEQRLMAGEFESALTALGEITAEAPDLAKAWMMTGFAHASLGRFGDALAAYVRADLICPDDVDVLASLGKVQSKMGFHRAAVSTLARVVALAPDDCDALQLYGDALSAEDRNDRAKDAYERILRLRPGDLAALYGLAFVLETIGDRAGAAAAYRAIIRSGESTGELSAILGAACKIAAFDHGLAEEKLDRYLRLAAQSGRATKAAFASAGVLCRSGDPERAWQALRRANAAMRDQSAAAAAAERAYRAAVSDYVAAFASPPRSAGDPQASVRPVFILGASQSGKTWLERRLAPILGAARTYESELVPRSIERVLRKQGLAQAPHPWLVPAALAACLRASLRQVLGERSEGAAAVTNTYPGHIAYVGLIRDLVPGAIFVFVTRTADDNAFRIFAKLYGSGNAYAYRLDQIYEHLAWTRNVWSMWQSKLGGGLLTFDYDAGTFSGDLAALSELAGARSAELHGFGPGPDRGCADRFAAFMKNGS